MKFPLAPGKRWFFDVTSKSVRGDPSTYSYDCRAEDWEQITLAGTTVRALKVACQSKNRNTGGSFGHTAWYSPEVKRVVRLVSRYTGGPTIEVHAWHIGSPGGSAQVAAAAPQVVTPSSAGGAPAVAERPTYQIGDKWIRSDGTDRKSVV